MVRSEVPAQFAARFTLHSVIFSHGLAILPVTVLEFHS